MASDNPTYEQVVAERDRAFAEVDRLRSVLEHIHMAAHNLVGSFPNLAYAQALDIREVAAETLAIPVDIAEDIGRAADAIDQSRNPLRRTHHNRE